MTQGISGYGNVDRWKTHDEDMERPLTPKEQEQVHDLVEHATEQAQTLSAIVFPHTNIADFAQAQPTESAVNKAARDYCTGAKSVISGALCGEDTTISNACRLGNGPIDPALCDDKNLQAAQSGVWGALKAGVQSIFNGIASKAPLERPAPPAAPAPAPPPPTATTSAAAPQPPAPQAKP